MVGPNAFLPINALGPTKRDHVDWEEHGTSSNFGPSARPASDVEPWRRRPGAAPMAPGPRVGVGLTGAVDTDPVIKVGPLIRFSKLFTC